MSPFNLILVLIILYLLFIAPKQGEQSELYRGGAIATTRQEGFNMNINRLNTIINPQNIENKYDVCRGVKLVLGGGIYSKAITEQEGDELWQMYIDKMGCDGKLRDVTQIDLKY